VVGLGIAATLLLTWRIGKRATSALALDAGPRANSRGRVDT
jgi:hypothetical protein